MMRLSFAAACLFMLGHGIQGQEVYPDMRYTAYSFLPSTAKIAAASLGYSTETWNTPGTASVELLSYESLLAKDTSSINALSAVSLDHEDTWDCYVNHFFDYSWSELEEWGIVDSVEALGWTESMWDDGSGEPGTEDMDWFELSSSQKEAAEFICYFQETVSVLEDKVYSNLTFCSKWDMEESLAGWGVSSGMPSCFSGNNLVETNDRGLIRMENLKVGDTVRTSNEFTRVYSISHLDKSAKILYKRIYHSGTKVPLEISPDHMMYANDKLVRADDVSVGDVLHGGHVVSLVKTAFVEGLYAPLTETGTLVVSGALTSSFVAMTDAVSLQFQHTGSHLVLFPVRLLCRINFGLCKQQTYTDNRSDFVYAGIKFLDALATMPKLVQIGAALLATPILVGFFVAERLLVVSVVAAVVVCLRKRAGRKQKTL